MAMKKNAKTAIKAAEAKETAKEIAKDLVKETESKIEKVAEVVKEAIKEEAPASKKRGRKPAVKKEAVVEEKAAVVAEPKKRATRKTTKKEVQPQITVHFQYGGKDLVAKEVLAQALDHYKESHVDAVIETVELYVVADENAAYYVINGEPSDDYKIWL